MNWELFFLLAAVSFAAGFVKGGFGLGAGVLLTPLLSLFIPPFTAIVLMSLILLLTDLDGIRRYRTEWNRREVNGLLPWGILGTCAGIGLLPIFPDSILQIVIALVSMFFVFRQFRLLRRPGIAATPTTAPLPSARWLRPLVGSSAGLIGYLSGTAGVILSMYFMKITQRRERTATLLAMLTIMDTMRVSLFGLMGYYSLEILMHCALGIPFLYLGALLGEKANSKLSDRTASYAFTGLLGIISVTLLIGH